MHEKSRNIASRIAEFSYFLQAYEMEMKSGILSFHGNLLEVVCFSLLQKFSLKLIDILYVSFCQKNRIMLSV